MVYKWVSILLVFVSSFPAVLPAQNSFADQVYNQLQSSYTSVKPNFASLKLERTIINNVSDSESDSWESYFEGGKNYVVMGACDNDCSDVDLSITQDDGSTTVVSDTDSSDKPVVSFKCSYSGRYTISLKMYDCNSSYCYSGFAVYSY